MTDAKHTPATLADEFERRAKDEFGWANGDPFSINGNRATVWAYAADMLREAIKQENSHVG